jgi:hypothetical protein
MQLSNWQLDVTHAEGTFASAKAQAAPRIPFAKPVAVPPPVTKVKPKTAKPAAPTSQTKAP